MSNYSYRKDHRTDEQFEESIRFGEFRERAAVNVIKNDYLLKGYDIAITSHGNTETGIVCHGNQSADADYIFVVGGKTQLAEIKVHPIHFQRVSFKESNLISYMATGADIYVVQEDGYYIFEAMKLELLIDKFDCIRTSSVFSGKPAYCIPRTSLEQMKSNNPYGSWNPWHVDNIENVGTIPFNTPKQLT